MKAGLNALLSPSAFPWIISLNLAYLAAKMYAQFANDSWLSHLYLEYLVDYEFGFVRRGLVAQLFSSCLGTFGYLEISIFGVILIVITFVSYWLFNTRAFSRRTLGLALAAITVASPCLFKNWTHELTRLDIFGILAALCVLSAPLTRFYVPLVAVICSCLILIHEAQFLGFLPVIIGICAWRLHCSGFGRCRAVLIAGGIGGLIVLATFWLVVREGNADVPPSVLWAHVQSKAADPVVNRVFIWYSNPSENMSAATDAKLLWQQLLNVPDYLLLLLLHLPVFIYIVSMTKGMDATGTGIILATTAVVITGALIIIAISHDRARWFSNLLSCFVLLAHAIAAERAESKAGVTVLESAPSVAALWIMTVIPKGGTLTPL
jgi:hypothetical protein